MRKKGQADGFFRYAITEAERAADPRIGKERWMPLGVYRDTALADIKAPL